MDEFIRQVGLKDLLKEVPMAEWLAQMTPEQLQELRRRLRQVGLKDLLKEVGMDEWLAQMTPEQLQELRRRLQETPPTGR
jgi:ribosomal protein L10